MALHLDIVCHSPGLSQHENGESVARVIGEILPFVLAKYGVTPAATKREARSAPRIDRTPSRFNRDDEKWNY